MKIARWGMWNLLKFLPRKFLSRLTGLLVHIPLPGFLAEPLIRAFAGFYRINLQEAEKPVSAYSSIGDFFVRHLKPGVRPLAAEAAAVHPADSRILQSGRIEEGTCVQAKGKKYSVQDFLVDPEWKTKFDKGYFLTYYLCPTDYHRVHSPVEGFIRKVTYVPGDLWPVHDDAVATIEGLYLVNERVVVDIVTSLGSVAVVFVGATNVGSIELSFDSSIKGNRGQAFTERLYEGGGKQIQKGEELGMFRMGSTVVVLYSEAFARRYASSMKLGPAVKVNSALV